jgi:hypothetical protein
MTLFGFFLLSFRQCEIPNLSTRPCYQIVPGPSPTVWTKLTGHLEITVSLTLSLKSALTTEHLVLHSSPPANWCYMRSRLEILKPCEEWIQRSEFPKSILCTHSVLFREGATGIAQGNKGRKKRMKRIYNLALFRIGVILSA